MDAESTVDALGLPRAAILQGDLVPLDLVLRDRARELRPAVRWWWGVRRQSAGSDGALCYLCGRVVTTWTSIHPMTRAAVYDVQDHRWHDHGDVVPPGTTTAGTSPAVDAPEGVAP